MGEERNRSHAAGWSDWTINKWLGLSHCPDREKRWGIRFCVNYRKPNAVTQGDACPMPRLDKLLNQLGKSQFMSPLDLARGTGRCLSSRSIHHKTLPLLMDVPLQGYAFWLMWGTSHLPEKNDVWSTPCRGYRACSSIRRWVGYLQSNLGGPTPSPQDYPYLATSWQDLKNANLGWDTALTWVNSWLWTCKTRAEQDWSCKEFSYLTHQEGCVLISGTCRLLQKVHS